MRELSILIPTTPDRKEFLYDVLLYNIKKQLKGACTEVNMVGGELHVHVIGSMHFPVSIYIATDDKTMPIGEKRERLYKMADGEYSWQIDSDDNIAENAIEKILHAAPSKPDCISFEEFCNIDGGIFSSNHSIRYSAWEGNGDAVLNDGFHYHRTPFFKDVIKTDLCKQVPVPHSRFGEDHEWAKVIYPLLKTEVHIDEPLYHYLHTSSPFDERYGIKPTS